MTNQSKYIITEEQIKKAIIIERSDTIFLRFIAICLVLNSHLDLYYPIAHIGTGGSIGNALFFILSSFGLFLSEKKHNQTYAGYFVKRVKRIYPSVWIVSLLVAIPIQIYSHNINLKFIATIFSNCLFPSYWFIQALILYYLLGFFIIKNYSNKKISIFFVISFFFYLYAYFKYLDLSSFVVETLPFKILFYNLIFIFGILLGSFNNKIKFSGFLDIFMLIVSILIIYGHKFLMTKNYLPHLQIIQQLMLFVLTFYAIKISRSSFVCLRVMQYPIIKNLIFFISKITLQIYIVHVTISPLILQQKLLFPYNMIIFLFATVLVSIIINWIDNEFSRFSSEKIKNLIEIMGSKIQL